MTVWILTWALVFPLNVALLVIYIVICPGYEHFLFLSSDVVYSGGAHTCISRQGWLWSSCPQALKVEREGVRYQERGEAEGNDRSVGGGNGEMRNQRLKETGRNVWEKKQRGSCTFLWSLLYHCHSKIAFWCPVLTPWAKNNTPQNFI